MSYIAVSPDVVTKAALKLVQRLREDILRLKDYHVSTYKKPYKKGFIFGGEMVTPSDAEAEILMWDACSEGECVYDTQWHETRIRIARLHQFCDFANLATLTNPKINLSLEDARFLELI